MRQITLLVLFMDRSRVLLKYDKPLGSSRSQHIHVRYPSIRDESQEDIKCISVTHVKSSDQWADIITKGLPPGRIQGTPYIYPGNGDDEV